MTSPRRRCPGRGAPVWLIAGAALLAGACAGADKGAARRAGASPSPPPASASAVPTPPPTAAAPAPQGPARGAPAPAVGLPKTVTFGRITFSVPEDWDIYVDGDTAYVGVLAGGSDDATLRVERNATGSIDSLKPSSCPREGDPAEPAVSVETAERGLSPVGDRNAEYRLWRVTCPGGVKREHRVWLLPTSKIVIYEQVHDPRSADVVRSAKLR